MQDMDSNADEQLSKHLVSLPASTIHFYTLYSTIYYTQYLLLNCYNHKERADLIIYSAVGYHYSPPGLRLPSQPESINTLWTVPKYIACYTLFH